MIRALDSRRTHTVRAGRPATGRAVWAFDRPTPPRHGSKLPWTRSHVRPHVFARVGRGLAVQQRRDGAQWNSSGGTLKCAWSAPHSSMPGSAIPWPWASPCGARFQWYHHVPLLTMTRSASGPSSSSAQHEAAKSVPQSAHSLADLLSLSPGFSTTRSCPASSGAISVVLLARILDCVRLASTWAT